MDVVSLLAESDLDSWPEALAFIVGMLVVAFIVWVISRD